MASLSGTAPMITPPPQSTGAGSGAGLRNSKRGGLLGGLGNIFSHAGEGVANAATSIVNTATKGAAAAGTSVGSQITAGGASAGSQITTGGASVGSQITSGGTSAGRQITAGGAGIASSITSQVQSALSLHSSVRKSAHIQIPKATPTDISPWGSPGNKLPSLQGIDIWDLGMQVKGGMELGGGFTADFAHAGSQGWATAHMFMKGSDWNFDFPLGLDFHGTNIHYENTDVPIGQPINLCEELGCIAVQDVFELASALQMNLNASIDVTASGKINMGTNISYAAPAAFWSSNSSKNASGFEPSNNKKWFNVSDGSIQVTGAIGVDLVHFNGLEIKEFHDASFNFRIVDGVSVVVTVTDNLQDTSKLRRDISPRGHSHDVLARELSRRDTCPGIGINLALEEEIMLDGDAGPLNEGIPLYATQIPLYSTCLS
ncbi:MAG: hypothetical protein M1821_009006 [Bathelium mastoideum]|nr:MAG: hypothetical protein M1821_009006 [Bathelium mastoideum]